MILRLAALVAAALCPTFAWAYVTDTATHAPPTSGAHAYYSTFGTFGPDRAGFPAQGQTFVDPVFGSTIRRLTNEVGKTSQSDIYAKNGFWNADGTRMFHNTVDGNTIIDTTTGAVVRSNVPGNFDSSFAPDDADTWYYFSGSSLRKYSIATGTTSLVKTFSGTLGRLGGSIDWIDNSGRYMVLSIGGSVRVWDRQSDVLYAGALSGNVTDGWAGISPDGKYVVAAGDEKRSYAINHSTRTVNTTGVMFWSLCGDHGDLVSASDGKTYMVTFECHSDPGVWAVDITIPQTESNVTKQRADNTKLFALEWGDEGHISAVSRGVFQDWAYVSVENNGDTFTSGVSGWRPYRQEIVMANVLTGEVRRLAHHRSRGIGGSYFYQPRASAGWDGARVAWASNFGYNGSNYADIYAIAVDSSGSEPPPPGTPTVTFTNPASGATLSGTATVTLNATGGSGTGYTYTLAVDGVNVYSGTNNSFNWNTTNVSNASHTLKATVTDSAGAAGTASQTVTVSNSATSTLVPSFTTSLGGTLTGSKKIGMAVTGSTASHRTFILFIDGVRVFKRKTTGTQSAYTWNTEEETGGQHALTLKVTDSDGETASTTLNVETGTSPSVTFSAPGSNATVSGSTTVTMSASGGSGTGYTYILFVDGVRVYRGKGATYTWDTTTVTNAEHTLRVKVVDSNGNAVSALRAVTVSNATSTTTGLVAAFTSPEAGATLGCWQTVGMKATGSTASTRTFKFYVNIYLVWQKTITGTTASYTLDTNWWAGDGTHTLKLQVTDSAGKSDTTTMDVKVRC